ncbi:MAG: putative two-component sensor histidine kinase protein [Frankiales bacterium]|nr:putative two-component sensor histidine kinase protein [Frankiales bacterium]
MVQPSAASAHSHDVTFYDRETEVVADVAAFVAAGLANGERVIIVATPDHRAAIDEVLEQHAQDPLMARLSGRYLTLDAAETLASFMVNGSPDRKSFDRVIGHVIDAAGADGSTVRVFGEMVALLWNGGNVSAAIQLEALWNGLAATRTFSLLCAYPTHALSDSPLNDISSVCELHSNVISPRSYSDAASALRPSVAISHASKVFVPVAAAVPAARRFVVGTLRSWGIDALIDDTAVVTSEIATNAVKHAASPFRVRVTRNDAIVRVAIEDVAPVQPMPRNAAPEDFGGRGLALVQQMADRWGCDPVDDGKAVWAEFHVVRVARAL